MRGIAKLHGKLQFLFVISKRFKHLFPFAQELSESLSNISSWYIWSSPLLLMKGRAWLRSLSLYLTRVYAEAVLLKNYQTTHFSGIIFHYLLKRDEYWKTVWETKQNCVPPSVPLSRNTWVGKRSKEVLKSNK